MTKRNHLTGVTSALSVLRSIDTEDRELAGYIGEAEVSLRKAKEYLRQIEEAPADTATAEHQSASLTPQKESSND